VPNLTKANPKLSANSVDGGGTNYLWVINEFVTESFYAAKSLGLIIESAIPPPL